MHTESRYYYTNPNLPYCYKQHQLSYKNTYLVTHYPQSFYKIKN